jgi:citrate lyase subunit beta/citryl-CoA lyase
MLELRRSKLFVPGNRPDRMGKAAASPADALSLDLEDAVPDAEKASARQAVVQFLEDHSPRQEIWVRVNGRETEHLVEDVLAVASMHVNVINVPKAEHPRDVELVEELLNYAERKAGLQRRIAIVPTIESPAGLRHAYEIAKASSRVVALQLGTGDLRKATGIEALTENLRAVRTLLSLAAAEAGVHAMDSAFTNVADVTAFETDAKDARSLGFRGKSCIHPSQVEIANRVFSPTDAEIEEAGEIIAAFDAALEQGIGAIQVNGKLIDGPIADVARRILEAAR